MAVFFVSFSSVLGLFFCLFWFSDLYRVISVRLFFAIFPSVAAFRPYRVSDIEYRMLGFGY